MNLKIYKKMKKLIYSAVMALVLSCFIGCMPRYR